MISLVLVTEAQQTERIVTVLIILLFAVSVLLAGLTIWYWRYTNPSRYLPRQGSAQQRRGGPADPFAEERQSFQQPQGQWQGDPWQRQQPIVQSGHRQDPWQGQGSGQWQGGGGGQPGQQTDPWRSNPRQQGQRPWGSGNEGQRPILQQDQGWG